MRQVIHIIVLSTVSVSLLGCTQLRDCVDERLTDCRVGRYAHKAWERHEKYWRAEPFPKDFGKGFEAGYQAVMEGRGERPPSLPPRKYWNSMNIGERGKSRSLAWFNGYHAGANCALGDGVEDVMRITVAEQIYARQSSNVPVDWNDAVIESHGSENVMPPAPGATEEPTPAPPAPPVIPAAPEVDNGNSESQPSPTKWVPSRKTYSPMPKPVKED